MNNAKPSLAHWQHSLISASHKTDITADDSVWLKPCKGLDNRINAYQNNYRQTLVDWLKKSFPMILGFVGNEYFQQLAASFIKAHPLNIHNFYHYGDYFPQHIAWLQNTRPELANLPYLEDLAKADWYLQQAYYSRDREPFNFSAFACLDTSEQLNTTFDLASDLRYFESQWPLIDLWNLQYKHKTLEQIEQYTNTRYFLIERAQYKPTMRTLSASQYDLCASLAQDKVMSELNKQEANLITSFIESGWITGFTVSKQ